MRRTRFIGTSLVAVAAALALPVASQAATGTSTVAGTVGTELSVAAATPAALSFNHTTPATTSSVVTVTSTQLAWTLSISDNNTGANTGKMLKTAGAGAAAVGSPLANALQWAPDGTTFTNLTATPAAVGVPGTLVGTKTVTYKQALGAAENVTAADAYQLTALLTVL